MELRSRLWNSTFLEVTNTCVSSVTHDIVAITPLDIFGLIWVSVFVFTQDYASLSSVDIIVKASLVLHTQAKNMILSNPETDVNITTTTPQIFNNLLSKSKLTFDVYCRLY